ncbi:MAG: tetratricopeptide repeat protein [Pseudomonas sp.]
MVRHRTPSAPAARPSISAVQQDIAFYERRAAEDPWSAADRAVLARLYLQRGRETGEYADFQRAERAARTSLGLRRERNQRTLLLLASSLLAQHRFAEARAEAETLVASEPEQTGSRALLAEILLELGDYTSADSAFTLLVAHEENLAVAPRLARWHELHGRVAEARAILLRSAAAARTRADLPAEQVAWFYLRVADQALRTGRLSEARRALHDGLSLNPGDVRLRSARARLAAARGDWREVLSEVADLDGQLDLATLALAGDAARALRDFRLADTYYAKVEQQARANPEPFARQWTQFCLEHGRHLDETVRTLEAEIAQRPDVLGHQLLAWAYQLTGRPNAARREIRSALRLATKDARLEYLAGHILGQPERLANARKINRWFDVSAPLHVLPAPRP